MNSKIPNHKYRVESEDLYEPKDLRTVICTSYNSSMRLSEAEEITSEASCFTNQEFSSLSDLKQDFRFVEVIGKGSFGKVYSA